MAGGGVVFYILRAFHQWLAFDYLLLEETDVIVSLISGEVRRRRGTQELGYLRIPAMFEEELGPGV